MKQIFKPTSDSILVLPDAEADNLDGIYLPDEAVKPPQTGIVVACGPGRPDFPMEVKPGEKAVYGAHSGKPIMHEGKEHLIMRSSEVFGTIEEK